MPTPSLLQRVNALVETPFSSLEACLAHYRDVLPGRVGDYHQEEVGPVYHHDAPGEADLFVRKIFHLGEDTLDMTSGLDWYATASGDLEWNGGLVRHGYFMLLAAEYEKTGRELYAETIIEHILHYIENVPVFDPAGKPYLEYKKSTWRPFEAAGRAAETWPEALARIIRSPAVTAEAWARDPAFQSTSTLSFCARSIGRPAITQPLKWPLSALSRCFYQRILRTPTPGLNYAVEFLDGMWPDLFRTPTAIHGRCRAATTGWPCAVSSVSTKSPATTASGGPLSRSATANVSSGTVYAELYQDKPDLFDPDQQRLQQLPDQPERTTGADPSNCYPFAGGRVFSEQRQGSAPGTGNPLLFSILIPGSGSCAATGRPQASYLFFDMGPWGDNHMNQDQLSVEVSALGRNFLINGGKWRYTTSDPSADWMPLAKYFKATASYNCVLVNGYGQVFGDAEGRMVTNEHFDYADGLFEAGFGEEVPGRDETLFRERGLSTQMENRLPGVTHRRQVFFIKPHAWIVRDTIEGPGLTHADQLWHFFEGPVRSLDEAGSIWATDFADSNLVVQFHDTASGESRLYEGQKTPFFAGWHCPYYDQLRPAPEVRRSIRATGRIVFHTLLLPVKGPVTEVPEFRMTDQAYDVDCGELSFRVHAPDDGDWSLT
jgi:hypothetical protein